MRIVVAAILAFFLLALPAGAQDDLFAIELSGASVGAINPQSIAALPRVEMDVTFQTSKGPSSARYAGVKLFDVFAAAGAFAGEHNAFMRKTFTVHGRDGYVIAFSLGEIHPEFGAAPILLAGRVDGRPSEGGYRIVVPGDTRGARNVREVVRIDLH